MAKWIMQRDTIVPTRFGHVLSFKAGKPLHVPPLAESAVMAAGGVPVGGAAPAEPPKEAEKSAAKK